MLYIKNSGKKYCQEVRFFMHDLSSEERFLIGKICDIKSGLDYLNENREMQNLVETGI